MVHSLRNLLPVVLIALAFCEQKVDQKDQIVRVGKNLLTKEDMDAYKKITGIYPAQLNPFFPGARSIITALTETEVLFNKSRIKTGEIKNSNDWRWKKRYFTAQSFLMDELTEYQGFTEAQVKDYFEKNKARFKVTTTDSTGAKSTTEPQFNDVKQTVLSELFWITFPPSEEFLSQYSGSQADSAAMKEEWKYQSRGNAQDLLMKKMYKDKYGADYPDSLSDIYGKDKPVTPADMDVIMSWIPQEGRERYKQPDGQKELAEWLLKWIFFSDAAEKNGYASKPEFKKAMNWAWKIEVVNAFVAKNLEPTAAQNISFDSTLLSYHYFDDYTFAKIPDSSNMAYFVQELKNQKKSARIDSVIFSFRSKAGVTFYQADFKDDKDVKPAELLAKADALRDSGNTRDAEGLYTTLSQDLGFTAEGKKATIELAKLQTESQLYTQAIKNYRKSLYDETTSDMTSRCNTFFMIGFIYDEYMNRPEKAELNYKWVLENAPECDLADDAEFMLLHLDEPMTSIEELQGEAVRQNRPVDDTDQTESGTVSQ